MRNSERGLTLEQIKSAQTLGWIWQSNRRGQKDVVFAEGRYLNPLEHNMCVQ